MYLRQKEALFHEDSKKFVLVIVPLNINYINTCLLVQAINISFDLEKKVYQMIEVPLPYPHIEQFRKCNYILYLIGMVKNKCIWAKRKLKLKMTELQRKPFYEMNLLLSE